MSPIVTPCISVPSLRDTVTTPCRQNLPNDQRFEHKLRCVADSARKDGMTMMIGMQIRDLGDKVGADRLMTETLPRPSLVWNHFRHPP